MDHKCVSTKNDATSHMVDTFIALCKHYTLSQELIDEMLQFLPHLLHMIMDFHTVIAPESLLQGMLVCIGHVDIAGSIPFLCGHKWMYEFLNATWTKMNTKFPNSRLFSKCGPFVPLYARLEGGIYIELNDEIGATHVKLNTNVLK
jgi:hypothetical protein